MLLNLQGRFWILKFRFWIEKYVFSLHPMEKNKQRKLDFMQKIINVKKIDPSPYQIRKHFDENKLKELAATIRLEGLSGAY